MEYTGEKGGMSVFDKEIRKCCAYCQHSQPFDENTVLCAKHGPVTPDYKCLRFRYDPLQREPMPVPRMKKPKGDMNFELK